MKTNELVALLQALKEPNGKLSEKAEQLKEKTIDALAERLDNETNRQDDELQDQNGESGEGPKPDFNKKDLPF